LDWLHLAQELFLKLISEGKIERDTEVTEKQGTRPKQLMNGLKERRGFWNLKEKAIDCTLWKPSSRRGSGPIVRQTAE
jgi:hypothetical protein